MNFGSIIIWAILILVLVILVRKFLSKYKSLNYGAVTFIIGGVKSGKTGLSVYLWAKEYKKIKRQIKFKNFFRKLFKKPLLEEPLPYSNMPVNMPYVQVTDDLLLRKKRFRFKSPALFDEVSLMVDSMTWKDSELNEHLLNFNKLFGHETHGGHLFVNTQSMKDLHYSFERVASQYYYIHHISWAFPFFAIVYLLEVRYSVDGTVTFAQTKDTDELLKKVIVPKYYFKKYDPYCYSIMTDDLECEETLVKPETLKLKEPLSFKRASEQAKLKKVEKEVDKK